jgi:hypothetical protein
MASTVLLEIVAAERVKEEEKRKAGRVYIPHC